MDKNKHLEDLSHIRSLMENSTKFISLSGLSGVGAGVSALFGAAIIYYTSGYQTSEYYLVKERWFNLSYNQFEITVALGVLLCALSSAYFFTAKKAREKGEKLWTKAAIRMTINLFIPLFAGGIFCIILMYHGYWPLVGPCTLLFYGIALLNAGKYTLSDIRKLGMAEIALGLLATFYIKYTLLFWALGFGVLHILYGLFMYFKYEK